MAHSFIVVLKNPDVFFQENGDICRAQLTKSHTMSTLLGEGELQSLGIICVEMTPLKCFV
jgi:hypothetical protein